MCSLRVLPDASADSKRAAPIPKASILHADLDAFYASVEQRDNPELRGRPMAVGGGVILAASYEARALGVRTAMNIREARQFCPGLIIVDPRMDAYTKASRSVFKILDDVTPLVEPLSVDEAFLDVSGLGRLVGTPTFIATKLRHDVANMVGLPISVGIARTKFLAKVASGASKPDGLLLVEPDGEMAFLHPLPVGQLWGVGKVTEHKLNERGITTVADVAATDPRVLAQLLGAGAARHLAALANNEDPRRVVTGKRRSSIGSQRALGNRARSFSEYQGVLLELVDRVCHRLRDGNRVGRTATLRFRFGDYKRDTRAHTLPAATASTAAFLDAGHTLLAARRTEIETRSLSLLGFTIANLSPADAVQQSLPFDGASDPHLDTAVDAIRDRFGTSAIGRASLIGRDVTAQVPLLPDPTLR